MVRRRRHHLARLQVLERQVGGHQLGRAGDRQRAWGPWSPGPAVPGSIRIQALAQAAAGSRRRRSRAARRDGSRAAIAAEPARRRPAWAPTPPPSAQRYSLALEQGLGIEVRVQLRSASSRSRSPRRSGRGCRRSERSRPLAHRLRRSCEVGPARLASVSAASPSSEPVVAITATNSRRAATRAKTATSRAIGFGL